MERNPTMTDIDFLLRQITTEDNKLSFQRLLSYIIRLFAYIPNVLSLTGKREKISYRKFFPPSGKIVNAS